MKASVKIRNVPVLVDDEYATAARIFCSEMSQLVGVPFVLRKSRYGVDVSQYAYVVSFNEAIGRKGGHNIYHLTLPPRPVPKHLGQSAKALLEDQMRAYAEKISSAYFHR